MEKISDIVESIANEKGLEYKDVLERIITAFIQTAKKVISPKLEYDVIINENTKELHLYEHILVVSDDDERLDDEHFISLKKARDIDSGLEIGDSLNYELNLENYGRTAAATLSREIDYHIGRLIDDKIYEKYSALIDTIVVGVVTSVSSDETTFIEVGDTKTLMPRKNRIKNEKFKVGQTIKAIIKSVHFDKKMGIKIELSRTSPKFLEALLRAEVPEIKDGSVIIQNCARIPGKKAKVAVLSTSPNVDAVGTTVGVKGVRINAVSKELNGENIDAIEFAQEPAIFISRALTPARVLGVSIDKTKAKVSIDAEQKSKAIGAGGVNIRLAGMLTGYEIELNERASTKLSDDLNEALQDASTKVNEQENSNDEGLKNLKALFGEE